MNLSDDVLAKTLLGTGFKRYENQRRYGEVLFQKCFENGCYVNFWFADLTHRRFPYLMVECSTSFECDVDDGQWVELRFHGVTPDELLGKLDTTITKLLDFYDKNKSEEKE